MQQQLNSTENIMTRLKEATDHMPAFFRIMEKKDEWWEQLPDFFGDVSSDIDKIGNLISTQLAIKHQKYFRCAESHHEAIAISKEKIRRLWGHTMKKSWSRLVLDRLNNFVKLGAEGRHDEERQNDFNETYNFSNPATRLLRIARLEVFIRNMFIDFEYLWICNTSSILCFYFILRHKST